MNNLKNFITIIALSLSTVFTVGATDKKPIKTKNKSQLRTEIVSLIGKKISLEIDKESTAKVSFIINNNNEIVVISIDSETAALNAFIKNKLNYKKITSKGLKKGEFYRFSLKIKQDS